MRARLRWILLAAGLVLAGMVALSLGNRPQTAVPLDHQRSLRILKVSFGTNHVFSSVPIWKKPLLALLPQHLHMILGTIQEDRYATPYDSLVVYFEHVNRRGERLVPPGVDRVDAVLPDGTVSSSYYRPSVGLTSRALFQTYARAEWKIPLRFYAGTNYAEVAVPNPRPATRQHWPTASLPQTACVMRTEVVLRNWRWDTRLSAGHWLLRARGLEGEPAGWMQWRTTLVDPWGNWSTLGYVHNPPSPTPPGAKSERNFKALVEGLEYLSAAFVELPQAGESQFIKPSSRACRAGVRVLMLMGPGNYEISRAFALRSASSQGSWLNSNLVQVVRGGWKIACDQPAALCVSEGSAPSVRLRERIDKDRGRIFSSKKMDSAAAHGMLAQLFVTPRLPALTTNLELEVMVTLPPATFFIERH